MRTRIVKLLLHWLVHNAGLLPAKVIVSPCWVRSVAEFLAELDMQIVVAGDPTLGEDIRLVA